MKMVSAAKYAKAERDLKNARSYGLGSQRFFENLGTDETIDKCRKRLLVLVTSDRGLCGAVHSSITKEAKHILNEKPEDVEYKLVLIGDKARSALFRQYAENILFSCNDVGKHSPTFDDASAAACAILNSGYNFETGYILYNKFKTVVSYETSKLPILPLGSIKSFNELSAYDSLDEDVLLCYSEYALAQFIYYAMKESSTSEQSSRMTAMEGATKNAGEMIEKLTMQFNRTRQAVITRELIEIISGAAAV